VANLFLVCAGFVFSVVSTSGALADEAYPLPLAASWEVGQYEPAEQYGPTWQIRMIEAGHHMMLGLSFYRSTEEPEFCREKLEVVREAVEKAAQQHLPLTLEGTQWEQDLYDQEKYFTLPAEKNPCWVDTAGEIHRAVSPFGPVEPWRQLGRQWTDNPWLKALQELYPDPPYVLLLSNNEAGALRWHEAEQSARYLAKYGSGRSDDFKRQVVGDGYIERYDALLEGMREKLDAWADKAVFVCYGGTLAYMGRWPGWKRYSLTVPGQISPIPFIWDGCSHSYYVNDWQGNTDGWRGYCPQVGAMNLVFQRQSYQQVDPDFSFELSTWFDPKYVRKMVEQGQAFPPERYHGYVLWGMWMLKPRVVRHFANWTVRRTDNWPWYQQIVAAVDDVNNNATLRDFWQRGRPVPNSAIEHPYQSDLPEGTEKLPRWYALKTNLDPWRPHDVAPAQILSLEFKVWSQAQVIGEKPNRRWLIYAHAPRGVERGVTVEIPDYQSVIMDVKPSGSYFVVDEKHRAAHPLKTDAAP